MQDKTVGERKVFANCAAHAETDSLHDSELCNSSVSVDREEMQRTLRTNANKHKSREHYVQMQRIFLISHHIDTELRGRVVPAWYSGGPRFKSRPGHWLP
jgi:hypothetical protein